MDDVPEFLYRIEGSLDSLHLMRLRVMKTTSKGVWVESRENSPDKMRLVLHKSVKKYAHLTMREAARSFIYRKRAQLRIITGEIGIMLALAMSIGDAMKAWEDSAVRVIDAKLEGRPAEMMSFFWIDGKRKGLLEVLDREKLNAAADAVFEKALGLIEGGRE